MGNKLAKKFASVVVSAATIASLSGLMPLAANAQVDLAAQIQALLAQVAALQAQLQVQGAPVAAAPSFTRDLTVGSKGTDGTELQNWLISQNKRAKAAALAAGGATGYSGSWTRAAVCDYQAAVGISPAAGYFGPKSRAYAASVAAAAPAPAAPGAPAAPSAPAAPTPVGGGLAVR